MTRTADSRPLWSATAHKPGLRFNRNRVTNTAASPRKRNGSILLALVVFAGFSVPGVSAQEMPPPPALPSSHNGMDVTPVDRLPFDEPVPEPFIGSLSLLFDNDFISGNDNRYTSGIAFAWTSAAAATYSENNLHRRIVNAFSFLPTVNAAHYRNYLQFVLRMDMYTASDITIPDPPPEDHPYAGVIYLDSSLMSMSRSAGHQLTLRLGFVGPASGASDMQKRIHEIIGSPVPRGWHTQLENEPIVNLFYQYSRRLLRRAAPDRAGFDFSWNGGAGFGNYYIGGNVGLLARVGYRLPDNYGVTPLLGGAESLAGIEPPQKRFQIYAFLAGQGFGVGRWLPTDGNTFSDGRSGDRDDWFASLSGGVVAGYGRVLVSYRYHGLLGMTDPENLKTENRNDFGTIMFTVFFG